MKTTAVEPVAFLAGSKVHLLRDGARSSFESAFGAQYQDRALSIHRRHAWKQQGQSAVFLGGAGRTEDDPVTAPVVITSVARDGSGAGLFYTLQAERVTGVFHLDPESGEERRLFHSNECSVTSVAPRPETSSSVACSLRANNGTSNLGLLDIEEGGLVELTEGDSLDESPAWISGRPASLLYQSAGVGRNQQGFVVGYGPRSIQRLDLDSTRVVPLAESDDHDLLCPQMDAQGNLYYIRRPWKRGQSVAPLELLQGLLLLPFHFVMMFFHIVNNYTRWYSKRPMLRAGSEVLKPDEPLRVWGQLLEEQKKGSRSQSEPADKPLVPESWQLVRQDEDGEQTIVAKSVLSFDLSDDGRLVWSDGRRIWSQGAGEEAVVVGKGARVTQVVALRNPS